MTKPVDKHEGRYKFWRDDNPNDGNYKGFTKWAKRMMSKARRRNAKREINQQPHSGGK